jgi:uncharacterized protein (DUF1684 family)
MDESFDRDAWLRDLEESRLETADYYLNEFNWRGSPAPRDFAGPRFYAPDERWRVAARLDRQAPGSGMRVQLPTSVGDMRDLDVYGTFVFPVDGEEHRLTAYRPVPVDPGYDELFVPFRDATSGKETYGAGRYLDVFRKDSDDYVLDFNLAYNPSCAYSPRYNCPYPPPQNHLRIPVQAGEKIPFEH